MTDANLMDADCIHGVVWYECQVCDKQPPDEPLSDAEPSPVAILAQLWADERKLADDLAAELMLSRPKATVLARYREARQQS